MSDNLIQEQIKQDYAYGFVTDVESVRAPKGLNKEVVSLDKQVSKLKSEFKKFKPHIQKQKEAVVVEAQSQTH
ncbi:MAG: hypothetical protein EBX83_02905 [Candidatus Fonsibacter ubiquis]|nr:hypothetical protein [Candidatus Fonsibacter ubiquis]